MTSLAAIVHAVSFQVLTLAYLTMPGTTSHRKSKRENRMTRLPNQRIVFAIFSVVCILHPGSVPKRAHEAMAPLKKVIGAILAGSPRHPMAPASRCLHSPGPKPTISEIRAICSFDNSSRHFINGSFFTSGTGIASSRRKKCRNPDNSFSVSWTKLSYFKTASLSPSAVCRYDICR